MVKTARRQTAAARRVSGKIKAIDRRVRLVGPNTPWQLSAPVLCCLGMLGSFVSRFRVFMLLLTFALGVAGQVASTAAMATQMQPMATAGMAADDPCPGCPGDQTGGMMANCGVIGCWSAPALPAQSATAEPSQQEVFGSLPDIVIAGTVAAPDPHPPRSSLHT